MRKFSFYILVSLIVTAIFTSCSGKRGAGESSLGLAPSDSIKTEEVDSIEAEPEPEVKKVPNLNTPEKQLAYMQASNHASDYEEGILMEMVNDAPEYSQQILESDGKRFIIVDKAKMKLFLYDPYGRVEKSYGIACAKNYGTKHKKGDSRTTEGCFKVKGVFDSREWLFTDDDGITYPTKGQYGPRFIRLTIPYIGIHGTGNPGSIGKRVSHGCIRVTNPNILELVEYVEEGMPVIISPGPRDMAVNQREGYDVPSVVTEPNTKKAKARWVEEPQKTETVKPEEVPVEEIIEEMTEPEPPLEGAPADTEETKPAEREAEPSSISNTTTE